MSLLAVLNVFRSPATGLEPEPHSRHESNTPAPNSRPRDPVETARHFLMIPGLLIWINYSFQRQQQFRERPSTSERGALRADDGIDGQCPRHHKFPDATVFA